MEVTWAQTIATSGHTTLSTSLDNQFLPITHRIIKCYCKKRANTPLINVNVALIMFLTFPTNRLGTIFSCFLSASCLILLSSFTLVICFI
jgi:hypothetical protein